MKLSERLQAMCSDFEHMGVNELTVSMDAIREAIALAQRVEGAAVIDPDSAKFLGQFFGRRVRIVPEVD